MKLYTKILIFEILIVLSFFAVIVSAKSNNMKSDNASISGYIKDSETQETLIGATVIVIGTKNGAYTNKSGYYSITNILPGSYKIKVSMVGYKAYEEEVNLSRSESLRKDYILIPNSITTGEVTVTSKKEVETREISISKVNIPVEQIKQIRIGGESDVFRSLQMLPGVLTSSQISSGLYIRGGSPDQNLVLLDGSTVYNPSHLFGFISTFNSDAIKDVELIKGGYPAEYGSRLSAVLNITQKDGNRNKFEGLASLGVISSKLSMEGPVGEGSWCLSGRRTYFSLIRNAINDPENPIPDFGFYDLNAKISQDFSKNDKVFLSGFISRDNFDFGGSGFDIGMFMGNRSGSLRWTHILNDNFFTTINFSGSHYENGMNQNWSGYEISVKNQITDYTLKANTEWFISDKLTLNSGLEITNYIFSYKSDFSGDNSGSSEGTNEGGKMNLRIPDWVYSAYTSLNHKITDLISLQAGLRVNYWDLARKTSFDPRAALRFQIQDNLAIKASWGIFHQYLRLSGDENFSLFDTWLPSDKSVVPSQATHYILSFETSPFEDIDFNIDFYYKDLKNISESKKISLYGNQVSDLFYSGNGYAYGGEIFLQKKVGRFAGWIGYGLGWVKARFDSINFGNEFFPKYDRRHDFKVVLQYQLSDEWTLSSTFMYQTGQPFTGAISRFQPKLPGDSYGKGMIVGSQRYGLRMPDSHQLNLTVNYNTMIFGCPFKCTLDVYNVYSRRDILMKFYNPKDEETTVEEVRLLPILPTMSFELKF